MGRATDVSEGSWP